MAGKTAALLKILTKARQLGASAVAVSSERDNARQVNTTELARRINRLFDVMHKRDALPLSTAAAADGITARGGAPVSATLLDRLRSGDSSSDPSEAELRSVAAFFGVAPEYLTEAAAAKRIDPQLDLLRALRGD
jgi:transcriptional regulator with XRE-family HTH domain